MRRLARVVLVVSAIWSVGLLAQDLIVNGAVPVTTITRNQARLYFTLRLKLWPDGTPVEVFVLPDDNPLHRSFCKKVLGLYPYQLRRVWDRMIFSGTGQAPTTVSTERQMIDGISSTPGAIGYAPDGTRHPGISTVEVD